jgi:hypothetical protein
VNRIKPIAATLAAFATIAAADIASAQPYRVIVTLQADGKVGPATRSVLYVDCPTSPRSKTLAWVKRTCTARAAGDGTTQHFFTVEISEGPYWE